MTYIQGQDPLSSEMRHSRVWAYKTTYLPVSYVEQTNGTFFKEKLLPTKPDIEAFLNTEYANKHLNAMDAEGWELLHVESVLKAVIRESQGMNVTPYGFAYPLTDGMALFWRRPHGGAMRIRHED